MEMEGGCGLSGLELQSH